MPRLERGTHIVPWGKKNQDLSSMFAVLNLVVVMGVVVAPFGFFPHRMYSCIIATTKLTVCEILN